MSGPPAGHAPPIPGAAESAIQDLSEISPDAVNQMYSAMIQSMAAGGFHPAMMNPAMALGSSDDKQLSAIPGLIPVPPLEFAVPPNKEMIDAIMAMPGVQQAMPDMQQAMGMMLDSANQNSAPGSETASKKRPRSRKESSQSNSKSKAKPSSSKKQKSGVESEDQVHHNSSLTSQDGPQTARQGKASTSTKRPAKEKGTKVKVQTKQISQNLPSATPPVQAHSAVHRVVEGSGVSGSSGLTIPSPYTASSHEIDEFRDGLAEIGRAFQGDEIDGLVQLKKFADITSCRTMTSQLASQAYNSPTEAWPDKQESVSQCSRCHAMVEVGRGYRVCPFCGGGFPDNHPCRKKFEGTFLAKHGAGILDCGQALNAAPAKGQKVASKIKKGGLAAGMGGGPKQPKAKITAQKIMSQAPSLPAMSKQGRSTILDGSLVIDEKSASWIDVDAVVALKQEIQSKHCIVCGHVDVDAFCMKCSKVFHTRCVMEGATKPLGMFRCWECRDNSKSTKKHVANGAKSKRLNVSDNLEADENSEKALMPCVSCGYTEKESTACSKCTRTFCFGCTTLSKYTLPTDNSWSCPDCLGSHMYDQQLSTQVEKLSVEVLKPNCTTRKKDAYSQLVFDLIQACCWDTAAAALPTLLKLVHRQLVDKELPAVMPFHCLHYEVHGQAAKRIAEAYSRNAHAAAFNTKNAWSGGKRPKTWWLSEQGAWCAGSCVGRKIRVGYFSADFVDHPTSDLAFSLFKNHDLDSFEIYLFATTPSDGSMYRSKLSKSCKKLVHLEQAWGAKRCAEVISSFQIDILVDFNGHTLGERQAVLALRPAPVQICYLGFPGTVGAKYIDFNVADPEVVPVESLQDMSETTVYMPWCYQINSFRELYKRLGAPPKRSEYHLPEDAFVFVNFNRLGRITREIFDAWCEILLKAPKSVLWLYGHPQTAILRLTSYAQEKGVDPARIVFGGPISPKSSHLERLRLADLYLDTRVYNGHTTGSDILWAGVPMITLQGKQWPGRVGSSLCRALQMDELVVRDLDEYKEVALRLALDSSRIELLTKKLEKALASQPLFDSLRWTRSWERSLRMMLDTRSKQIEDRISKHIHPVEPNDSCKVPLEQMPKKSSSSIGFGKKKKKRAGNFAKKGHSTPVNGVDSVANDEGRDTPIQAVAGANPLDILDGGEYAFGQVETETNQETLGSPDGEQDQREQMEAAPAGVNSCETASKSAEEKLSASLQAKSLWNASLQKCQLLTWKDQDEGDIPSVQRTERMTKALFVPDYPIPDPKECRLALKWPPSLADALSLPAVSDRLFSLFGMSVYLDNLRWLLDNGIVEPFSELCMQPKGSKFIFVASIRDLGSVTWGNEIFAGPGEFACVMCDIFNKHKDLFQTEELANQSKAEMHTGEQSEPLSHEDASDSMTGQSREQPAKGENIGLFIRGPEDLPLSLQTQLDGGSIPSRMRVFGGASTCGWWTNESLTFKGSVLCDIVAGAGVKLGLISKSSLPTLKCFDWLPSSKPSLEPRIVCLPDWLVEDLGNVATK